MKQFPQYEGKKVLVFGLGLNDGGLGMVDFFVEQGAEVTITDGKTEEQLASTLEKLKEKGGKLTFHLGGHLDSDFADNDIIIRNPAIKPDNPYLKIARDAGKTIEMEMSLFFKLAPCKIVGISGTKGKSTTTTLTYLMLKKKFGGTVVLAGNIGKSAIRELPKLTKENLVVLEMSSFQLDALREAKLSPQASLLTNIYEDHLNWHKDMADYIDCKQAMFTFQKAGDITVLNIDDPRINGMQEIARKSGATIITFSSQIDADYSRNGMEIFEHGTPLLSLSGMKVDGEHNYQNALGAIALARQFEVTPQQITEVLSEFTGVDGREQLVREINGIQIYNDTTATAMESMLAAMNRFGPKFPKKIIMIAGGMDKGMDYSQVTPVWNTFLKALVLLEGTASEKMATVMESSEVPVHKYFGIFKDAVEKAYSLAQPGDMIILCPGGTSFNMFANEFDRGRQFNDLVNAL